MKCEVANTVAKAKQLIREENLLRVKDFCLEVHDSVIASGVKEVQARKAWETGTAAACMECGTRVSGEDLYQLCTATDEDEVAGSVRRLRLGYCARIGCEGWLYRIEFRSCAEMDWPAFFETRNQAAEAGKRSWVHVPSVRLDPFYQRVALGTALILVLLAARQWRIGGEIPLIREARHFQVDVAKDPLPPAISRPAFEDSEF